MNFKLYRAEPDVLAPSSPPRSTLHAGPRFAPSTGGRRGRGSPAAARGWERAPGPRTFFLNVRVAQGADTPPRARTK